MWESEERQVRFWWVNVWLNRNKRKQSEQGVSVINQILATHDQNPWHSLSLEMKVIREWVSVFFYQEDFVSRKFRSQHLHEWNSTECQHLNINRRCLKQPNNETNACSITYLSTFCERFFRGAQIFFVLCCVRLETSTTHHTYLSNMSQEQYPEWVNIQKRVCLNSFSASVVLFSRNPLFKFQPPSHFFFYISIHPPFVFFRTLDLFFHIFCSELITFSLACVQTFTRWMNAFLKKRGLKVDDIATQLSDGLLLINLLEIISSSANWLLRHLGFFVIDRLLFSSDLQINISQHTTRTQNTEPRSLKTAAQPWILWKVRVWNLLVLALKVSSCFLQISFVLASSWTSVMWPFSQLDLNFSHVSADLVDPKLKLILGLIWTIILRYQIQKGRGKQPMSIIASFCLCGLNSKRFWLSSVVDEGARDALLRWVQSKIPWKNVQNFTTR